MDDQFVHIPVFVGQVERYGPDDEIPRHWNGWEYTFINPDDTQMLRLRVPPGFDPLEFGEEIVEAMNNDEDTRAALIETMKKP